jgi:TetR/AcrR family transcriptional regulator, acrAB operon repressor
LYVNDGGASGVRRTKEQSERTRQQILEAARREFAAHGVTRTSLQDIASAAGVTRGAVYWHFTSKRDLFRAMREQVSLPLFDHAELPGADDADPLLAIEHFLHGVVERMGSDRQTRQTFDILSLKCEYVGELRSELSRHLRRCQELRSTLASVYRNAQRLGVMRNDITADDAALGTCVFVTGLVRLWVMDRSARVLRPQAGGLVAAHVAALRREGGESRR